MAEIYGFTLPPGYTAKVTYNVSLSAPAVGFYLQETDHDSGESIYLTQTFAQGSSGPGNIPEPGSWLLVAAGAGLLCAARRRG